MDKVIKKAFNARTQKVEDHVVTIAQNGEYIFTAKDGTFFKFPAHFTAKEIEAGLVEYEKANKGQLTVEAIEAQNALKLEALKD